MSEPDQSTSPGSEVAYRTIVGRLKGVPEVKTDSRQKQFASLAIFIPDSLNRDSGETTADEWFNIAAYGEKVPVLCGAEVTLDHVAQPRRQSRCLRSGNGYV